MIKIFILLNFAFNSRTYLKIMLTLFTKKLEKNGVIPLASIKNHAKCYKSS